MLRAHLRANVVVSGPVEEDEEVWLACPVPVVALLEFADAPRNFPQVAVITVRTTRVERRR